jgi:hypothetical protein
MPIDREGRSGYARHSGLDPTDIVNRPAHELAVTLDQKMVVAAIGP